MGFSNQRPREIVEQELRTETVSLKWYKTKKGSFICELFGQTNIFSLYICINQFDEKTPIIKKMSKVFV